MDNNKAQTEVSTTNHIFDVIFSVFFNVLFYILFNKYYSYIPFFNEDFVQIVPLYNLSIMFTIFFHASRLLFNNRIYKAAGELISVVFFVVISYQMWRIFPFDLSWFGNPELFTTLFKILIVITPILAVIGTITNFVKAVIDSKVCNSR